MVAKLKGAETAEAVISLAAEKGFTLTAEDLKPEERTGEIFDDELDSVAGGKACWCALGGGGKSGRNDKTCACVVGGAGLYTDGKDRCGCGGVGIGDGE